MLNLHIYRTYHQVKLNKIMVNVNRKGLEVQGFYTVIVVMNKVIVLIVKIGLVQF